MRRGREEQEGEGEEKEKKGNGKRGERKRSRVRSDAKVSAIACRNLLRRRATPHAKWDIAFSPMNPHN